MTPSLGVHWLRSNPVDALPGNMNRTGCCGRQGSLNWVVVVLVGVCPPGSPWQIRKQMELPPDLLCAPAVCAVATDHGNPS